MHPSHQSSAFIASYRVICKLSEALARNKVSNLRRINNDILFYNAKCTNVAYDNCESAPASIESLHIY